MTQSEGARWIDAADSDLAAAKSLFAEGFYHLVAFHAQQAAEKALKGLLRLLGRASWGHSCFDLLADVDKALIDFSAASTLLDSARRLDGHYIQSRYPDAFPSGLPADYYDAATAQQAINDATDIVDFVNERKL